MFENVFKLLKIKSLSRIEPELGMEPKNRQNRSINEDRSPPPLPLNTTSPLSSFISIYTQVTACGSYLFVTVQKQNVSVIRNVLYTFDVA